MAEPLAKKQKMSPGPFPDTIFTRHGQKPDTLLKVFDVEFHVNSMVLKMNTRFFYKFLDPANGLVVTPPASSPFKYEWYTKLDTEQEWYFSTDPDLRNADLSTFKGNRLVEQTALYNVLCAIFGHPYTIKDMTQLEKMTKMADYYFCLPALSSSLSTALFRNPDLINNIQSSAAQILEIAFKLRHEALFKEAFIHVLGPWINPQWRNLSTPKLKDMASDAENRVKHKLLDVHWALIQLSTGDVQYGSLALHFARVAMNSRDSQGTVMLPKYLRGISELRYEKEAAAIAVERTLRNILKSNLELDRSRLRSGEGKFEDCFLCGGVRGFPWDTSEKEWH